MGMIENVISAIEKVLIPKLDRIENEQKALRELMEEKFRALREVMDERFKQVDLRFQALEDKLNLDKRLTLLENEREERKSN